MQIITEEELFGFGKYHADCRKQLSSWAKVMKAICPKNLPELREAFPTADQVGDGRKLTCFNIKGRDYRLITQVVYPKRVIILELLTHAEYTKKYC